MGLFSSKVLYLSECLSESSNLLLHESLLIGRLSQQLSHLILYLEHLHIGNKQIFCYGYLTHTVPIAGGFNGPH